MTLSHTESTRSLLAAADIITAVRALAPEIQSRGDEIAALRRLPVDLVTKLKATGAFRMAMPKAWGGPEMTPREQCEVYEVLGAADASVAWCVKISSDSGDFAAQLDEDAAQRSRRAAARPRLSGGRRTRIVRAGLVGSDDRESGGYGDVAEMEMLLARVLLFSSDSSTKSSPSPSAMM